MIKKIVLTIFALIPFAFIVLFLSFPSFSSRFNWFSDEPYLVPTVAMSKFSEEKLFDLVQIWRKENNLSTYKKSEVLCGFAESRLGEVLVDFSHDQFYSSYRNNDWYGYNGLGENLVKGYINEKISLDKWLKSPAHRETLDNTFFTESCIRCSGSTCVQIFAGY